MEASLRLSPRVHPTDTQIHVKLHVFLSRRGSACRGESRCTGTATFDKGLSTDNSESSHSVNASGRFPHNSDFKSAAKRRHLGAAGFHSNLRISPTSDDIPVEKLTTTFLRRSRRTKGLK